MSASQLQFLTERLTELYRRPTRIINDYSEESLLCAVSSRPGVMDELEEIMTYRSRLPAKEKRFFPNSLYRLLCGWQEVLDRARMYDPEQDTRPKSLSEVRAVRDAKLEMAQHIKGRYCLDVAGGEHWKDREKHGEYLKLQKEARMLTRQIAEA